MFKIISDEQQWDQTVRSFKHWDVYYLYHYAQMFHIHGDGEPLLIYYEADGCRLCYVMMRRDIADSRAFSQLLSRGTHYDLTAPYGYGGPLIEGDFDDRQLNCFLSCLEAYARQEGLVSQFLRFHPLLANHVEFCQLFKCVTIKQTVSIDTSDVALITRNYDARNRNTIKKARRLGVRIVRQTDDDYHQFQTIYGQTMKKCDADDYYRFGQAVYSYLQRHLSRHYIVFNAVVDNDIVSSAIFLYNDRTMHYHLSGTKPGCYHYQASNLILDHAAKWASVHGIKQLHIGGGVTAGDSLFSFKKKFNRRGIIPFFVGATVFDEGAFQALVDLRRRDDPHFEPSNNFLITYRKDT